MSEQIVFYIKEDIKNMVDTVPDITIGEANIIKIILLEFHKCLEHLLFYI